MVVPGLYGYVSATKWLVDLEVTRFDKFSAYWTERGWSEKGPVKTQSRIDVPGDGATVKAGAVRVGGSAWAQHTGIEKVEYQLDGGTGRRPSSAACPAADTWVQWAGTVDVEPGRAPPRRPRHRHVRLHPDPRRRPTSCLTAPPDGTPSRSTRAESLPARPSWR